MHVKGRGKKRHLTEGLPEPITEWKRDEAQLYSQILNSLRWRHRMWWCTDLLWKRC